MALPRFQEDDGIRERAIQAIAESTLNKQVRHTWHFDTVDDEYRDFVTCPRLFGQSGVNQLVSSSARRLRNT